MEACKYYEQFLVRNNDWNIVEILQYYIKKGHSYITAMLANGNTIAVYTILDTSLQYLDRQPIIISSNDSIASAYLHRIIPLDV